MFAREKVAINERSHRERRQIEWSSLRSLSPFLWPPGSLEMRLRIVVALTFLTLAKVATVSTPLVFKRCVDLLANPQNVALILPLGLLVAYALLRVTSTAFGELRDAVFARVAHRAIRGLALQVFRHLHGLSLSFHLDRRTGGISRSIERGTAGVHTLLTYMLFNILPTLIEICLVSVILAVLFPLPYVLVTALSVAAYAIFTSVATEQRMRHIRRAVAINRDSNAHAVDSLLNYETVKHFGNEEFEAQRYDAALARFESASVAGQKWASILRIGQATIVGASIATLMVMAGQNVMAGTMTIGDFVAVNMYLMQLFIPLDFLGHVYRTVKDALVDLLAMVDLLDARPEIRDVPGATALVPGDGAVRFEHVHFGYDPRRTILRDVSFTVPAGHSVAIVGASGAGKSTIARLLFRFYDVSSGAVRIDGQDIRTVTQASLRAAIGVVPQDTVLFNETVYYNIAYGNPSATPAQVEEAARRARIHDFIMKTPDGYQTRVGERGLRLSGGERQRVAIARAFLKNPRIIVLDEATSALDSHTEKAIQASLKEVSRGRTTLIVAHRLSTIVDADEILVLHEGCLVESGTHAQLLARNGLYASMWKRQQLEETDYRAGEAPGSDHRKRNDGDARAALGTSFGSGT